MLDALLPATKANNRRNPSREKFQARPARYQNLITPQRFRRQSTLTSRAHANRNTFHPTFVKT